MQWSAIIAPEWLIFAVEFIFFVVMIPRTAYISFLDQWRDHRLVKVVTGIRRSGKSTILEMFRRHLVEDGVGENQIISLNFEDLDNEPYLDYHALYAYVCAHLINGQRNYVFFDEVQLVADYQKVVDSLMLREGVDIYMTGSNAYLLSGELATRLTGRYVELRILPLSFSEFLSALPQETSLNDAYRRYVECSSFPYAVSLGGKLPLIKDYLSSLYNTIVLKDIMARSGVADVMMLESVVRFLADNIGNISVVKRISDTLTSAGRRISVHTVESYLSAITASYIFYAVPRYDLKGLQHLKSGQKYYLADVGLRQVMVGTRTGDLGHILENVVYLELLRRGGEVYVGRVGTQQIDFVVVDGGLRTYYQVALSVRDEQVLRRELAPLLAMGDSFPKYLLTLDNDPVVSHKGILQMYALDWLVKE